MSEDTCPLCKLWKMMPYHKRWSTPTTPQECEGAMIAGWWAAYLTFVGPTDIDFAGQLCERHQAVMVVFNDQHTERKRIAEEMKNRVSIEHAKSVQDFLDRARNLVPPAQPKPLGPPPVIPVLEVALPPPAYAQPQPAAPNMPATAPPPVATMERPQPPQAPVKFPCPLCSKPISNGEVHDCSTEDPEPQVQQHTSR